MQTNTFFLDIFEYHHYYNQLILEELKKHSERLPEKPYKLFCHIINAHQIWNARILEKETLGVFDVHSHETCKILDKKNLSDTVKILEEVDLDKKIIYANSQGKGFSNSVAEILFHAANHATHHKGQIISSFRQQGIEPVITDYIFYKRIKPLET